MKKKEIFFLIILGVCAYFLLVRMIGDKIFEARWKMWNGFTEYNFPLPKHHWYGY
jgi:hypothetical protein